MSQFALPIPVKPLYLEDNFYISDCNREAFETLKSAPPTLLLSGPAGSGKSHLGHLWADRLHADTAQAADWSYDLDALKRPLLLENIESLKDERSLFHLINSMKERSLPLLLTSRLNAATLPFTLPDLTSRLKAMPATAISAPDDAALAGVMRKQFADRQLKVDEEVFAYLAPRMERSFAAAAALVEHLDAQALATKRHLTIPFVRQLLGY